MQNTVVDEGVDEEEKERKSRGPEFIVGEV